MEENPLYYWSDCGRPRRFYAGVAQSVVQLIRNQQVAGSSPVTSSKKGHTRRGVSFFDLIWGDSKGSVVNDRPVDGQSRTPTEPQRDRVPSPAPKKDIPECFVPLRTIFEIQ